MITLNLLLRVVALICFVLVALNVPPSRINYLGAGLVFWVLSTLLL